MTTDRKKKKITINAYRGGVFCYGRRKTVGALPDNVKNEVGELNSTDGDREIGVGEIKEEVMKWLRPGEVEIEKEDVPIQIGRAVSAEITCERGSQKAGGGAVETNGAGYGSG